MEESKIDEELCVMDRLLIAIDRLPSDKWTPRQWMLFHVFHASLRTVSYPELVQAAAIASACRRKWVGLVKGMP